MGQQETSGQGIGGVHQGTFGIIPKAGGMEAHYKLVQAGFRGKVPTVEVILGPYRDKKGGAVQVQTT